MRLLQRVNWVWAVVIIASAAVTWVLSENHMVLDPLLVSVLVFMTNIGSLLEGRRQKHEEQVFGERSDNARVLHSSDSADTQPSDHGAVHGHSDEEHPDTSEGS